ncbi:hypothetical protein AJ80_05375 [Polytolypa hystricis UAMH7299]|uniref:Insulin-induced protein n=1 Tax=Polytolypa hystricis (strain UAMH7299) TaxID=1447883 RepID=A0A2B7XVQ1_POLH7|nr:hypothetical protein AJ80_05375 [Polytolypa hystricis UAMH7299]
MDQQQPPILRPRARRPFELAPENSEPATPHGEADEQQQQQQHLGADTPDGLASSSRTRSILNLTSSTLLGIYSPTAFQDGTQTEPQTPWGTGAQTPRDRGNYSVNGNGKDTYFAPLQPPATSAAAAAAAASLRHPVPKRHGFRGLVLPLALRSVLLALFGVAYGTIITTLHDNPKLTPIRVENIDYSSWPYLVFWGAAGVALGNLLPWFDTLWEDFVGEEGGADAASVTAAAGGKDKRFAPPAAIDADTNNGDQASRFVMDWNPVVRSVGAFVGIAFAIRRLPWQSTFQVSLTLALVNPFLWYLIDRSKPGFILSSLVGLSGMTVLLGVNPQVVPPPPTIPSSPSSNVAAANASAIKNSSGVQLLGISHETIAVATWIASVLFCSCVCFGNIGRRLALGRRR